MTAHCAPEISNSYFVVMIDYGRKGLEAIVDPEITRRGIISRIGSGEYPADQISFIHFIKDECASDVTHEILSEATDRVPA